MTSKNTPPPDPTTLLDLDDESDSHESAASQNTNLLSISFNQDGGCLAIGTSHGFRIYNVYPFQETFRRQFDSGGVSTVEMLFRCNLLGLVGGGSRPRYPPNKVMIWDDHRGRPIGELSFRQTVLGIKLRRDRVAVALNDRVYLYNFSDLTLLDQIPTAPNPLGLLSLSPDNGVGGGAVLACPSINRGGVRVELYGCRKTVLIDAHESSLASITLTVDGSMVATASERGTVIRIFSTRDKSGHILQELRRGVERAKVNCLAFSLDKMWLGLCSDRGTAHVFRLGVLPQIADNNNDATTATGSSATHQSTISSQRNTTTSRFASLISKVLPWDGEGSYAQIRGIDDPTVCAFVPDRPTTLAVVGKKDGSILLADFGKGPGEAERVGYHVFFKKKLPAGNTSLTRDARGTTAQEFIDEQSAGEIVFGDEDNCDGFVSIERNERKDHENICKTQRSDLSLDSAQKQCDESINSIEQKQLE